MSMTENCPTDDVRTTLNYLLPNPDGSSMYYIQPREGLSNIRTNYIIDPRNVVVHNLRGREQSFSLDENGFQFLIHQSTANFADKVSIETEYYAEVRELLRELTGAHRVLVLGHKLRQGKEGEIDTPGDAGRTQAAKAAHIVHGDRTPESTLATAREHLGEGEEHLLQGRLRFITVWRPIGDIVQHEPLAIADWQTSCDKSDLLPLQIRVTEDSFHAYVSRFNSKHRWYYLKHQAPSEVTLIKCYDSRTDGCARLCLHTAFHDPGSQSSAPKRRSIEVNALLFG